jgi:hypothetical protein
VIIRGLSGLPRPRGLRLAAAIPVSLLLGACSCEPEPWGATYITIAEAAHAPPACEVHANAAASAAASGTHVDPNLVEIARLEVERDCYKGAEADLRQRLQRAASLK